jgi:hypothetical protein
VINKAKRKNEESKSDGYIKMDVFDEQQKDPLKTKAIDS